MVCRKFIHFASFVTALLVGTQIQAQDRFPTLEEPMQFVSAHNGGNCFGCAWVSAQGVITPDTPKLFAMLLAEGRDLEGLVFHSLGGSVTAGIELGRMIRSAGISTSIGETRALDGEHSHLAERRPGVCASACAFAFIGGVNRMVGADDLLGVHQFYPLDPIGITSSETQRLVGLSLLHAIDMDVDSGMIVAASAATPDEMYWFSESELRMLRLDNTATEISTWRLEPYKGGLVLSMRRREGAYREVAMTLFCRTDGKWRLLISEEDPHFAPSFENRGLYDFDSVYRPRPQLTINDEVYILDEKSIENFRVNGNWMYLNVIVPKSILAASGYDLLFDPDLPRVYSSLLAAEATLPGSEWLEVTRKNCI